MPGCPKVVAIDMIGTLFSLEAMRPLLTDLGLPAHALELWFARTLRDGFSLAATGTFQPLATVGAGTLRGMLAEQGKQASSAKVAVVLEGFSHLPAQPDAATAVQRLQTAGVRILALTNGNEKDSRSLLAQAGLLEHIERIVSIDEVGAWKPSPTVYRYAAHIAREEPSQLALVAAHAWDCHGAQRAGLIAGWVSRLEKIFNPALGQPDVQGETLTDVVDKILQLRTE